MQMTMKIKKILNEGKFTFLCVKNSGKILWIGLSFVVPAMKELIGDRPMQTKEAFSSQRR